MMKMNSRRNFINSLLQGTAALGAFASLSFTSAKKRKENLPVISETDICVLGGSCTGVFAAVRAARLGARVTIIEKQNAFGGVATNSLVNIWHSLQDTEFKQQIIAGLTAETMDRLALRQANHRYQNSADRSFTFNSQELKIELDELILESKIRPYLHTFFSEPYLEEDKLKGVVVDNKSGRGIIKAKYFIDATGDGDLCLRLGLDSYTHRLMQPPTTCAHLENWDTDEFYQLLKDHGAEFKIPDGFVWGAELPGTDSFMLAGTRMYNVNCSAADDLTKAEMEGRRQIRAILDMFRKYGSQKKPGLVALPSSIGIRETRHIKCLYQVRDEDTLNGIRFKDAIANCSYRMDLHHQDKPGLTFKYLDGTEVYSRPGFPDEKRRWRSVTESNPTFYQVPVRSLIPPKYSNLMIAGRMLDAQMTAFSGIRVMVNMNQLGEAAGVTSYLALAQDKQIAGVDPENIRAELRKGGSVVI